MHRPTVRLGARPAVATEDAEVPVRAARGPVPTLAAGDAGDVPGCRTIDELAASVGLTVRTVRFYASKGLLPPPHLVGRVGWYDDTHRARLTLVRDLQEAGFTLQAIEGFVARVPQDATPDDIAVFHALLAPWVAAAPDEVTREELDAIAGRRLDDAAVDDLVSAGSIQVLDDGRVRVRPADLELGLQLLDLGVPRAMIQRSRALIDAATGQLAEDLAALLRQHLLRPYLQGEVPEAQRAALAGVIARLKPLTIQAVMAAMQSSVDRAVRQRVDRARPTDDQPARNATTTRRGSG
jgi:DNA-binding transcriptional MerR regulator